jgi:hypothetical protein
MVEMKNLYKILVGNPEGKEPLEGYRHKWEDDNRMSLRGT